MSEISENVIFKTISNEKLELNERFVGLKIRNDGIMSINFRCNEEDLNKISEFFGSLKGSNPFTMDIGNTGDINCYFKGISSILRKTDETGYPYCFLSVTAQELKKPKYDDSKKENCGCFSSLINKSLNNEK
ncbi:MAG: hypothetical protein LBB45_03495 [Methanobrevibacter sp.]|jgi:hypothetical protein|nr:hypothetical protein [Candidatus Methanovirga basalitermitum]